MIGSIGKLFGRCLECMMGGEDKLLIGVKSIYFNSLACARVKGVESEWFLIDSGVRQGGGV